MPYKACHMSQSRVGRVRAPLPSSRCRTGSESPAGGGGSFGAPQPPGRAPARWSAASGGSPWHSRTMPRPRQTRLRHALPALRPRRQFHAAALLSSTLVRCVRNALRRTCSHNAPNATSARAAAATLERHWKPPTAVANLVVPLMHRRACDRARMVLPPPKSRQPCAGCKPHTQQNTPKIPCTYR